MTSSTDDEQVCSFLDEADELLSSNPGGIGVELRESLLNRLRRLEPRTDSGVALCRLASVWTQLGGEPEFARVMLVRAEVEPIDYDGFFDDFEEEDSFRQYLAAAVHVCLNDSVWVDRLLTDSMALEEFEDHVGDSVWFIATTFSKERSHTLIEMGFRERLEALDGDLDLASMQPLLNPVVRIFGSDGGGRSQPELSAELVKKMIKKMFLLTENGADQEAFQIRLDDLENYVRGSWNEGEVRGMLLACIENARSGVMNRPNEGE